MTIACLVVWLVLVWPTSGQVARIVPLQELVDRADLIVVGKLTSGVIEVSGGPSPLTIEAVRVLAGDVQPGTQLNVTWMFPRPKRASPYSEKVEVPREYGLWFVVRTNSGDWNLLPAIEGAVPVDHAFFPMPPELLGVNPSYAKDAPVLDRVIWELGAAVEAQDAQHHRYDPLFFACVRGLSSDALMSEFRRLARSPSANVRSFALAGLIERSDAEALLQFEREFDELADASLTGLAQDSIELFFRNPAPEAIAALGRLTTVKSGHPSPKRAATFALRVMHTEASLKYFVELLDSPEPEVRYNAMAGLASFANLGHVPLAEKLQSKGQPMTTTRGPYTTDQTRAHFPTTANFAQDEGRYIAFWKNWWARHEHKINQN